jgi:hypothetical protein
MSQMNNPWGKISVPFQDINARRVDHAHPLDLFWGKDRQGRYMFICGFAGAEIVSKDLPDLAGIQVFCTSPDRTLGTKRLVLMLNHQANWEIFLALCEDLIRSTRDEAHREGTAQTIIRQLRRWQELLKRVSSGTLSEEQIRGLIGELVFIRDHLVPVFGAAAAISFWQGPEGLPQDFSVNDAAVEVKSHLSTAKAEIHISSAEQLSTVLQELYLFVLSLGVSVSENSSAVNLPQLVDTIAAQLESQPRAGERFRTLLLSSGYLELDLYKDFNYIVTTHQMYQVRDGFPRIRIEDVVTGVSGISYSISLHSLAGFEKHPPWLEVRK